jgi:hypothetical protein
VTDQAALLTRAVDELRRLPCRYNSQGVCPGCAVIREHDAWVAAKQIIQTPAVAANQALDGLRRVADRAGERHD